MCLCRRTWSGADHEAEFHRAQRSGANGDFSADVVGVEHPVTRLQTRFVKTATHGFADFFMLGCGEGEDAGTGSAEAASGGSAVKSGLPGLDGTGNGGDAVRLVHLVVEGTGEKFQVAVAEGFEGEHGVSDVIDGVGARNGGRKNCAGFAGEKGKGRDTDHDAPAGERDRLGEEASVCRAGDDDKPTEERRGDIIAVAFKLDCAGKHGPFEGVGIFRCEFAAGKGVGEEKPGDNGGRTGAEAAAARNAVASDDFEWAGGFLSEGLIKFFEKYPGDSVGVVTGQSVSSLAVGFNGDGSGLLRGEVQLKGVPEVERSSDAIEAGADVSGRRGDADGQEQGAGTHGGQHAEERGVFNLKTTIATCSLGVETESRRLLAEVWRKQRNAPVVRDFGVRVAGVKSHFNDVETEMSRRRIQRPHVGAAGAGQGVAFAAVHGKITVSAPLGFTGFREGCAGLHFDEDEVFAIPCYDVQLVAPVPPVAGDNFPTELAQVIRGCGFAIGTDTLTGCLAARTQKSGEKSPEFLKPIYLTRSHVGERNEERTKAEKEPGLARRISSGVHLLPNGVFEFQLNVLRGDFPVIDLGIVFACDGLDVSDAVHFRVRLFQLLEGDFGGPGADKILVCGNPDSLEIFADIAVPVETKSSTGGACGKSDEKGDDTDNHDGLDKAEATAELA